MIRAVLIISGLNLAILVGAGVCLAVRVRRFNNKKTRAVAAFAAFAAKSKRGKP